MAASNQSSIDNSTANLDLAVALYDFAPVKTTDLGFSEGDVLQILKRSDSKNWWKAKHVVDRGAGSRASRNVDKIGDIPKTYIELYDPSAVVVAFHPWAAQDDTEISFTVGTIIIVTEKQETGWFKGRTIASPVIGMFPGTYVRPYRQIKPPKPPPRVKASTATTSTATAVADHTEGPKLTTPSGAVLSAIHGDEMATFTLDDFDAFDALMANGWCFNPDFAHHGPSSSGQKAVPGQEIYLHIALFRWDGHTEGLQRLASTCAPGGNNCQPISFRVAHESWFEDDDWFTGKGTDDTKIAGNGNIKWVGLPKLIAAVHLAVQQMDVGGVAEIVAAPNRAFGEEEQNVGGTKVVRNSQILVRLCIVGVGDKRHPEPKPKEEEDEDWDPDLNPKPVKRGLGGGERAGRLLIEVEPNDGTNNPEPQDQSTSVAIEDEDDELAAWDRQMQMQAGNARYANNESDERDNSRQKSIGSSAIVSAAVDAHATDILTNHNTSGKASVMVKSSMPTHDVREPANDHEASLATTKARNSNIHQPRLSNSMSVVSPHLVQKTSDTTSHIPRLSNLTSFSGTKHESSKNMDSLIAILDDAEFSKIFGITRETFNGYDLAERRALESRIGFF